MAGTDKLIRDPYLKLTFRFRPQLFNLSFSDLSSTDLHPNSTDISPFYKATKHSMKALDGGQFYDSQIEQKPSVEATSRDLPALPPYLRTYLPIKPSKIRPIIQMEA